MTKVSCSVGEIAHYDVANQALTHITASGEVNTISQPIEGVALHSTGVNDCTTLIVKDKSNNHYWMEHVSAGDIASTYGDRMKQKAIRTALSFHKPEAENKAYAVLHYIKNTQSPCELEIIVINNSTKENASVLQKRFAEILGAEFKLSDVQYFNVDNREEGNLNLHQVEFSPEHADKFRTAPEDPEVGPEIEINDEGEMVLIYPEIAWNEHAAFEPSENAQNNNAKLR